MKKLMISCLINLIVSHSAFGTTLNTASLNKKLGFAPLSWSSNNTKDIITIQGGSGFGTYFLIQIYVSNMYNGTGPNPSGINIKNCGNISHVSPGSTALCMLSYTSSTISFSSDSDDVPAYGLFQISEK